MIHVSAVVVTKLPPPLTTGFPVARTSTNTDTNDVTGQLSLSNNSMLALIGDVPPVKTPALSTLTTFAKKNLPRTTRKRNVASVPACSMPSKFGSSRLRLKSLSRSLGDRLPTASCRIVSPSFTFTTSSLFRLPSSGVLHAVDVS